MWSLFARRSLDFLLPKGVRIYAVGDIHGKADLLAKLQEEVIRDAADFAGERIIEVYLGDYIDRGLQSSQVIDLLLKPPSGGHERITLRGNHEQAMLDALENTDALRGWMQFGGLATLDAYGVAIAHHVQHGAADRLRAQLNAALPPEHREFLSGLPLHYSCGDYYFVHAGVRPGCSLARQKQEDKLWIRDAFLSHAKPFEKYIVHGHTPYDAPQILPNRAGLDVSDAPEPCLCALRIEGASRRTLVVNESGLQIDK